MCVLCKASPADPELIVELPPRKYEALRVRSPVPVRAAWPVVDASGRARGRIPQMASWTTHALYDLVNGGTLGKVMPLRHAHYEKVANHVVQASNR